MPSDPETWVFPPRGASIPPVISTASFGPVFFQDLMILEWTPASQGPEVFLTCTTPSIIQVTTQVCKGAQSPYTYTFSSTAKSNGSENIFCHMHFSNTQDGNTVVWQFLNQAASSPTTWLQSTPQQTTSITIMTSSSPAPTATMSVINSNTQSQGLSAGASAGIGIGAAAALLMVMMGLYIYFRRRQRVIAGRQESAAQHQPGYKGDQYALPELQSSRLDAELTGDSVDARVPELEGTTFYGPKMRS